MVSDSIETFEARHEVLRKISWRYVGWMWEHDELVNQMWLSEKVRMAQTRRELVLAGFDAMKKYFRRNIKRNEHDELFDDAVTKIMLDLFKMDMDYLLKPLTRTQALIIKMRCDGYTFQEISGVVGLTRANLMTHVNRIDKEPFKEWIVA